MSEEEQYHRIFESERSRTVVLLGFLSILLTARVELNDSSFFNFPWWCDNHCPHLTLLLLPTFTNWIYSWIGYVFCMLVYFSEDRLDKYDWSRPVREFARKLGHLFVWWYPVTVVFFSSVAGLSFNLPDAAQTPYWLTVFLLFGYYLIRSAEETVGAKILGKKSVFNKPLDSLLGFGREGTQVLGEAVDWLWRWVFTKARHPRKGSPNPKLAMRIFIFTVELVIVSYAYFIGHLFGYGLLYAFGIPLYAFLIIAGIIGWLNRRKSSSSSKSEKQ